MAFRAISSGTIAFGLVSIPVKLFPSASPSDGIRFNNLHRDCGSRLRNRLYCPKHDKTVDRSDVIKGYEFTKGQYVTFEDDELKAVAEKTSGGIDITEFVPIDQVDPIYYDKGYYLQPDGGTSRAYHLLAEALRRTGLVAVAKYAARGKQYLVLLRPVDEGLVMQQLHYPAEMRPIEEIGFDPHEVKEGELALAMQLIQQGASKTFDPDKYQDEVRERVEALIARKVEGEDITQTPEATPKAQVIDLMTALKQSLSVGSDEAKGDPGAAESDDRRGPKASDDEAPADDAQGADG